MTPERWQQVRDVLHGAMQLDPAQREQYLAQHCSIDLSFRQDLDSLLAVDAELCTSFLDSEVMAAAVSRTWMKHAAQLIPGTRLGRYEILEMIGVGGMGQVYRARDTKLPRMAAIKVLPSDRSADPLRCKRFEHEARAISALQHPNICTLYDVGVQDNRDFLVMEYLEGETLGLRLRRGALSLSEVLRFGFEIADALDSAHQRGIVHRDLKPGNIFLTVHGECKVLDFGLAKIEEGDESILHRLELTNSEDATGAGQVLGTAAYMSPEQARGLPIDSRTDLFSLGVVLYVMATGVHPFGSDKTELVLGAILERTPVPPARLRPDLPLELERVIGKALQKDVESRYQKASELRADLQGLQLAAGPAHTPIELLSRLGRVSRWKFALAMLALISCVLAIGLYWKPRRSAAQAISAGVSVTPCPGITSAIFVRSIPFFGGEGAGITVDPAGTVYIAENPFPFEKAKSAVLRVTSDGATQRLVEPPGGFGQVTAVAIYRGDLYVADGRGYANPVQLQPIARNVIWKWNPATNGWSEVVKEISNPTGLAFSNGYLYVSTFEEGKVDAYDLAGHKLGTVWSAPSTKAWPYGIAFDQSGNLFIAGYGQFGDGTKIYEVRAGDVTARSGQFSVFLDAGVVEPVSLTFDASGDLYASYYNASKILRVAANGSYLEFPGAGTREASPNGIAIDSQNNLYVVINDGDGAEGTGGRVVKIRGLVDCMPAS